ncbi:MAG TPA: DNA polymerase III subunit delta' [Pyrinomonadaceae bacterium]|nr:DNA polymerase III subunit delta' [Pyrinomonadaceae bacterium]
MLDQLAGNERVKNLLKRMLVEQRLPGAMLFTGEEGIGKKLFALEIARALNCRTPQGVEGCGKCPACIRIAKFNYPQSAESDDWKGIIWSDHPDVGIVVAPKRVLLVDQMRQIEREANFRPYEGAARVFLIDDADKLNDSSANALLKVLEEPPQTSYLILLTSRPAMLLPTIRSRCQVIGFSPLASREIEDHLAQNKITDAKQARIRARVARGSLGRALEQDLDDFTEQRDAMLAVLKSLAANDDRMGLLKSAEELNEARYKDEYEIRLDVLETLIRDAWMLSLGVPAENVVNYDVVTQLEKIAQHLDSRRPARWINQIEEMREQLIVNINRKSATDALFLTMAAASGLPPKRRFLIK